MSEKERESSQARRERENAERVAAREDAQAERERKDAERAAENLERQQRQSAKENVQGSGPEDPAEEMKPGPTGPASDADDKPKPKPRGHKKAESEE